MGRIPFTIRLVCFEEGFVQGQEESRQVFRGNRTDLFGDDAFSEGVTSAGIDVEGRFHGVADFLAAPRRPRAAVCWTAQFDGQPEKWHFGRKWLSTPRSFKVFAISASMP